VLYGFQFGGSISDGLATEATAGDVMVLEEKRPGGRI